MFNNTLKSKDVNENQKCVFFKKRLRTNNKKESSSDSSEETKQSSVVKKERKLISGISLKIKKKIKSEYIEFSATKSDRSAVPAGPQDQGATSSWDVDGSKETLKIKNKKIVSNSIKPGPMIGSTNIRSSIRWDYAPDICKDYKETGYCGFGDTCKFMHDRGDYKMGWQLEKEYDSGTYGKQEVLPEEPCDKEDELPFACFICRNAFIDPVITKCNHYFCLKCALNYYKISKKCIVCKAQTYGIFNAAKDIHQLQEKKLAESKNING